ncbi:hypothetical protein GCM10029964_044700 [Kibdelosporangium lantanae]
MTDWIDVPYSGAFDLSASAPTWRPVGALVRQDEPDGRVQVRIATDPEDVPRVRRILSLGVDGTGFPAVADRDPVVGDLQAKTPPGSRAQGADRA